MDKQFKELVHFVISYVQDNILVENTQTVLRKQAHPDELLQTIPVKLTNSPLDASEIKDIIQQIIAAGVITNHPYFMNQMFGKTQPIAFLADILLAIFNTSMYTYEVAPVFSLIEKEVISSLGAKIWGPGVGDGVFTAGGSMSNMNALFLARQHHLKEAKKKGLFHQTPIAIFVSEQAHYSFTKGVNFLGFGLDSLIKIPSKKNAQIDVLALEKALEKCLDEGRIPMMLIGIAGTTISGTYDDLQALAAIAKKHNMWFHVDAAYGGSLLFSEKYHRRLAGIEKADSVSWNFHKIMGMTLSTASFLTREKGLLNQAFNVDAGYLFHENDYDYDLGQKSLQGGRRPDAFKIWLTWKYSGEAGLKRHVEKLCKAAETMAGLIQKEPNLELFAPPESTIVCFRYTPDNLKPSFNEINKKIRDTIFVAGKIIFNYATLNKQIYLRCVLLDPQFSSSQLAHILHTVVNTGKKITKDYKDSFKVSL